MRLQSAVGADITQNLDRQNDAGGHGQTSCRDMSYRSEHHRERLLGGLQSSIVGGYSEHDLQECDSEESFRGRRQRTMFGELMHHEGRGEEDG